MEVVEPINLSFLENLVVILWVHYVFFKVVPTRAEDVIAQRKVPVDELNIDFEFFALLGRHNTPGAVWKVVHKLPRIPDEVVKDSLRT